MKLIPLTLQDRAWIEPKLRTLNFCVSEYSFANLYLFRDTYQIRKIENNDRWLIGTTRDHVRYAMPIDPIEMVSYSEGKSLAECIFPIPSKKKDLFKEALKKDYLPENSDYLFRKDVLIQYAGRKFDGIRWNLKQFLAQGPVRVESLSEELIDDAKIVLTSWLKFHPGKTDGDACFEALSLQKQLGLIGWIFYQNNEPVGFAMGEFLKPEVFLLHFAKALGSNHPAYPFIYQTVAKNLTESCLWINWEQDLGMENLRKGKSSYHPDQFILKWRIW